MFVLNAHFVRLGLKRYRLVIILFALVEKHFVIYVAINYIIKGIRMNMIILGKDTTIFNKKLSVNCGKIKMNTVKKKLKEKKKQKNKEVAAR
jgi:hypothetical protein